MKRRVAVGILVLLVALAGGGYWGLHWWRGHSPVVELPVSTSGDALAVVLSGDGGWADLDRDLAARLQAHGMPVVGFDCLRWFWTQRTPDEAAAEVSAVIARYRSDWHRDRVILIGYSFGGSILPAVLNRMPPELREHVSFAVILGSNTWANWEIMPGDWLIDIRREGATEVLPEIMAGDVPLMCVYGAEEEKKSVCPQIPPQRHAQVVRKPGAHHYDGNYEALADLILERHPTQPRP